MESHAAITTAQTEIAGALPEGHRVLHELVLPASASPDVVPLYIEASAVRAATGEAAGSAKKGGAGEGTPLMAANTEAFDASSVFTRRTFNVPGGQTRSLGTYFNAFPASYWRRWTPVRSVTLTVATEGSGQIIVMKSNAKGAHQRVDSAVVNGKETSVFTLSLDAFGDGGWYWVDFYAGEGELLVKGATYSADETLARETQGTFSISMTTMNKVSYCMDNIATLSACPELLDIMDAMYVIDQGTDRLNDHPEQLAELDEAMQGRLQIIEQGNIGGSGGFSRGMYEASTNGTSTYVINCDDDIVIEPESIRRLVTFADFATKPTLVGAHMFDLNNRSVLHTFGEIVDSWRIQPAVPHPDMTLSHDMAAYPLRSTRWLHRRTDVDYNGWWCCLIPTEAVRDIGLSLPVFIKWDDAEYGLRAKAAGYPTVSLPGAGVWHMAWGDKDDLVGWQAFFHERNRIITALLYSPYDRGGRLITESQFMDVKHLLSMQYYTEAGRYLAQQDVLRGPEHLHAEIGTALPNIRAMAAEFDDGKAKKDIEDYPTVKINKPPRKGKGFSQPHGLKLPLWTAKQLAKQMLSKPAENAADHPQTAVAHQDARWWRLAYYDSALVSNAEGTQVSWYKRDPKAARAMLKDAVLVHAQLFAQWNALRTRFRESAQELTSFEAWEKTFADNPAPVREEHTK